MAIYSFDKINREIPIEDVLAFHGIYPNAKGMYSIRPEDDTPSAHIDKKRRYGNTIHDFGETGAKSNTFNPLSLTMYLRNLDSSLKDNWLEAARILGEAFGIEPEYTEKERADASSPSKNHLSDWEWKKISIHPDMASKNMEFYPEIYGFERTKIYADKFRISMSELQEKALEEVGKPNQDYLPVFCRILRENGVAHVKSLRSMYYSSLYNWYMARCDLNVSVRTDDLLQDKSFAEDAKELALTESALLKALEGTGIKFAPRTYDVAQDFQKILSGDIEFEMGRHSKFSVEASANRAKAKVFSCPVSLNEYYRLLNNGLDNIEFAAVQKGDKVKLFFVSTDSGRVNFLVRALRGKELNLSSEYPTDERVLAPDDIKDGVFSNDVLAKSTDSSLTIS